MFTIAQQVSYSNWNPGEPNDSGGEDCVHLLESTHKWNDINCARNHSYICQKGNINILYLFMIFCCYQNHQCQHLKLKLYQLTFLHFINGHQKAVGYMGFTKIKSSCVFLQNFMYYERPVQPNVLSTQRSFVKRERVWLNKTNYKNLVLSIRIIKCN